MQLPEAAKKQGCVSNVSIMQLCKLADRVQRQMGGYSLSSSNCQDFCNKILGKLGLSTHSTTAEKVVTTVVVANGVATICNVM